MVWSEPPLILRRADVSRKSGPWSEADLDAFDGDREVGCIYRLDDRPDSPWFWGISFQLTNHKSCGHAPTFDEAKAEFKAEYLTWEAQEPTQSPP